MKTLLLVMISVSLSTSARAYGGVFNGMFDGISTAVVQHSEKQPAGKVPADKQGDALFLKEQLLKKQRQAAQRKEVQLCGLQYPKVPEEFPNYGTLPGFCKLSTGGEVDLVLTKDIVASLAAPKALAHGGSCYNGSVLSDEDAEKAFNKDLENRLKDACLKYVQQVERLSGENEVVRERLNFGPTEIKTVLSALAAKIQCKALTIRDVKPE